MPRFNYAIVEDVLRKFELDISESDFGNEVKNSETVLERIRSHLEGVESEFENLTDKPYREVRIGFPDTPGTYEYLESYGGKQSITNPTNLYLNHREVVPLDSTQDDVFEIRTGRDTWKDKTDAEGDEWRADYKMGKIEYFAGPGRGTLSLRGIKDWGNEVARLSYRYGALGGDQNEAGQTALTNQLTDGSTGDTTVDNLNRLVYGQNIYLLEGSEYVLATVDGNNFSIDQRGMRNTTDEQHPAGSTVHYCPLHIRDGISAKAAIELLRQDDTLDILIEAGSELQRNEKIRQLESQWNRLITKIENQKGSK